MRLIFIGAFVVACILFALINLGRFKYPDVILYAPIVTLGLVFLAWALEWVTRPRNRRR
jgi:hypothetical protein